METPLTKKKLSSEDILEEDSEFRFLSFYRKQNCKNKIIIFSLLLILFLLILFFFLIFKPNNNTNITNKLKITNEQNARNETDKIDKIDKMDKIDKIDKKNFLEICRNFPFSLIIDYGKIQNYLYYFDYKSQNNIKYEKEAFFSYDKINIEQNSLISNSDNIGISIINDIIPFFSDSIYNSKIDSLFQDLSSSLNIIVKSQILSLSIKREDIKFDDSFLKGIKEIGFDISYSDRQKASLLNNIFKNYGFFIPLKIYFGGYFYLEVDKIKYQKNKELIDELKSNVNIKFDNDTSDNSILYKNFFKDLFSYESINIIGGSITKKTLDEWKNSFNDNNLQIVGYENLIPITDLLKDVLGYDSLFLLSKPFNLINEKYELRRKYLDYLKQAKNYKGDYQISQHNSYTNGICEQNKLIYSERFQHTDKGKKFEKYYEDIIVGLKIIENWNHPSNGDFTLQNPIFKKYISINFKGKPFRGISFDIIIYLLKDPDKITIN